MLVVQGGSGEWLNIHTIIYRNETAILFFCFGLVSELYATQLFVEEVPFNNGLFVFLWFIVDFPPFLTVKTNDFYQ